MSDEVRFALPRSASRAARGRRDRMRALVHRLYALVHAGLWALGATVLLWIIFNGPALSEWHARAEAQRTQDIADENGAYCEKWGLRAGTHAHTLCILDLQELRANHARRLAEEMDGLL